MTVRPSSSVSSRKKPGGGVSLNRQELPRADGSQGSVTSGRLLRFPETSAGPEPEMSLADRIVRIKRALTVLELEELLSTDKATLYKHAAEGRIPSFRIGTKVLFDPLAVAKWLRQKQAA